MVYAAMKVKIQRHRKFERELMFLTVMVIYMSTCLGLELPRSSIIAQSACDDAFKPD